MWASIELKEVCSIEKRRHTGGATIYLGLENIESSTGQIVGEPKEQTVGSATFAFTNEHLLYGRLRPYLNKLTLPDFNGHCSSEIFPLKPHKELDKHYLFYWFLTGHVAADINATCTGARMPRANMNAVMKFNIPLPPLPEQKRIVAILDEAFEGIDAAIANTQANLAAARELFESYLGHIFTTQSSQWQRGTLGKIGGTVSTGPFGSLLHKSDYVDGGIPLVNPANIRTDKIIPDTRKAVSPQTIERLSNYKLSAGDIVVGRRGEIGRCAVVTQQQDGWLCGTGSFVIRSRETVVPSYLAHMLRSEPYRQQLEKASTGATMKNLSNATLQNLEIALPSVSQQKEIISRLDELDSKTAQLKQACQQKLDALHELKQSILAKAFRGELTQEEIAA